MKEYIERSAIMGVLQDIPAGCIGEPCNVGLRYARVQISAIPAADVAPVKHGRWIVFDPKNAESKECSVCGYLFSRLHPSNYCPNCGARMEG